MKPQFCRGPGGLTRALWCSNTSKIRGPSGICFSERIWNEKRDQFRLWDDLEDLLLAELRKRIFERVERQEHVNAVRKIVG